MTVKHAPIACLYFSLSTNPDDTRSPMFFTEDVVYIGRSSPLEAPSNFVVQGSGTYAFSIISPDSPEAASSFVDLDLPSISRRHARITRQQNGYVLENWEGKYGIGVYERRLEPGDTHMLRHSDIFRIPDLPSEHFKCLFLLNDGTQKLPLQVENQSHEVYIFGDVINFTPLEYKLVDYLYKRKGQMCYYHELATHIWPDIRSDDRKRDLEVLLVKVRKKIRAASGGFTFMQTLRGEGVRLAL